MRSFLEDADAGKSTDICNAILEAMRSHTLADGLTALSFALGRALGGLPPEIRAELFFWVGQAVGSATEYYANKDGPEHPTLQ